MAKACRSTLVFIIALVVFQTTTYLWRAHKMMPVAGLKSLSDFGLVRSQKFVVLTQDAWPPATFPPLTTSQQKALEVVFKRFGVLVYRSTEDVPESGKVFIPTTTNDVRSYDLLRQRTDLPAGYLDACRKEIEHGRKLAGYTEDMSFKWELERSGLFWMKCMSSHWISTKGAEYRTDLFIWFLGRWVRAWNFSHEMA